MPQIRLQFVKNPAKTSLLWSHSPCFSKDSFVSIWRKPKPMNPIVAWGTTEYGCVELAPTKHKWKVLAHIDLPSVLLLPVALLDQQKVGTCRWRSLHEQKQGICTDPATPGMIFSRARRGCRNEKECEALPHAFCAHVAGYRPGFLALSTDLKLQEGYFYLLRYVTI